MQQLLIIMLIKYVNFEFKRKILFTKKVEKRKIAKIINKLDRKNKSKKDKRKSQ